MAGEENFDVDEIEDELHHVGADDGDGSLETGIDQDVAVGGGDEIGGQPFRADVVEFVGNATVG